MHVVEFFLASFVRADTFESCEDVRSSEFKHFLQTKLGIMRLAF